MDRRHFILALSAGAALLGAAPGHAECGGPSAIEFVEDLYQKQARLLAENAPPAEEDFLELFSPGMRALMQAPRRPGRNVSLGPLLNAFFGWGVLPRTQVTIGKVRLVSGQDEGPATVGVALTYRGETHRVLVHVILDDGWHVANVIYDNGKSLIDHYREISGR
jgi:sirohydrochlorin ferrochelatase